MKITCTWMIICFLLVGCSNLGFIKITPEEIDKIQLKLVQQQKLENGIIYSIKLINDSKYIIKQNNIYLYYPLKTENGSKGNVYKVELNGNRLEVRPGDEIILNAFTPYEGINQSEVLIDDPALEIRGYIEKIDERHSFGKVGVLNIKGFSVD
jgi:hypothetical protein